MEVGHLPERPKYRDGSALTSIAPSLSSSSPSTFYSSSYRDLAAHGFDRSLRLVSSRREDADSDMMDADSVPSSFTPSPSSQFPSVPLLFTCLIAVPGDGLRLPIPAPAVRPVHLSSLSLPGPR